MTTPDRSTKLDDDTLRGIFGPLPASEHYHGEVWHFTDAGALVSIVKRRRLWASAATMMNDPGELTYGADRIKRWYEREGGTLPNHPTLHMILRSRMNDFEIHLLDNPA